MIRKIYYMPGWDSDLLDNAISGHSFFWNSLKHIYSPADIRMLWALQAGHEERWLPDKDGLFERDGKFVGQCFSSSMRYTPNGKTGCRILPAAEVVGKHPERWYVISSLISEAAYSEGWWFIQAAIYNNKGYDKRDILEFFSPKQTQDITDWKFICSGACHVYDHWLDIRKYTAKQKTRVRLISPTVSGFESVKAGGVAFRLSDGQLIAK
jgi:hypothetical protein